ncbi:hypothetical protein LOK49_LG13G02829 [Camellia lanceoleosa]|uniref:Uncharacterized protein n=1 Tax=Camellia lanceoleosa TaxID=1840588 RepID=A0ACC0FER2_9ERIC|nr:hypothetical protein LOK49_LG13G02829 [Camellia lanceoleosa]
MRNGREQSTAEGERRKREEEGLVACQNSSQKLWKIHLKVTRHCLPDLSDISSLFDLPLQPSVIRRVTRLRGICLESVLSANLCASRGGSGYVKGCRYVI